MLYILVDFKLSERRAFHVPEFYHSKHLIIRVAACFGVRCTLLRMAYYPRGGSEKAFLSAVSDSILDTRCAHLDDEDDFIDVLAEPWSSRAVVWKNEMRGGGRR